MFHVCRAQRGELSILSSASSAHSPRVGPLLCHTAVLRISHSEKVKNLPLRLFLGGVSMSSGHRPAFHLLNIPGGAEGSGMARNVCA